MKTQKRKKTHAVQGSAPAPATVTPEQLRVASNMLCAALERYHSSAALCRRAVWLAAASVAISFVSVAVNL